MDTSSKHAIQLLNALTTSKEQISSMEQRLGNQPEILSVTSRYEPEMPQYLYQSEYKGRVRCELSAELHNGRAITWWFSILWSESHWEIECEVGSNDSIGYRTIHEFDKRTTHILDGCIQQIEEATNNIIMFEKAWVELL